MPLWPTHQNPSEKKNICNISLIQILANTHPICVIYLFKSIATTFFAKFLYNELIRRDQIRLAHPKTPAFKVNTRQHDHKFEKLSSLYVCVCPERESKSQWLDSNASLTTMVVLIKYWAHTIAMRLYPTVIAHQTFARQTLTARFTMVCGDVRLGVQINREQ